MHPLATTLLLGIGAQWMAWRMRLPSILLLLLFGFFAGPFTDHVLVDPDAMFGDTLLPFVSLSVGVILFEGGLTLRFGELRRAGGRAALSLIFLGSPLTFILAAGAARWTLSVDWPLAMLLGAILVVTGPTVILPLLRHVRPTGPVSSVLRWEGIVTDPIGAVGAVLVFQVLFLSAVEERSSAALLGVAKAIGVGGLLGVLGALLLVFLIRRGLIPDFLHAAVTLLFVLTAFVTSNQVQHESGLLAVTLMGITLANQRKVSVEHIVHFKENLGVLLISILFILLAARLPLEEFTRFDLRSLAFVVLLIFVVRPAMVFVATLGTKLTWPERAFVAWLAPRGIVAAAVASVFALELEEIDYPGAERLVPVVFLVIIVTVTVYGLSATPLARRLGISKGTPQGILFVGAHSWARDMARALQEAGQEVLLVDTNHHEVQTAKIDGLPAHYGSILAEDFEVTAPIEGIGQLVCVTHNDEVNALACLHFTPEFGRNHVFQVVPEDEEPGEEELPMHLRGRALFGSEEKFFRLEARFRTGGVKRTRLGDEFTYEDFLEQYDVEGAPVIPLFLIDAEGKLKVVVAGEKLAPKAGDTVIALVEEPDDSASADTG